jgi:AmiR/NasT family two-component response regulator
MALKLIVAEDEAIIRLDLVELLAEAGFEVIAQTGRGDEAVELVKEHKPDLIVLDIKMPGMEGLEATVKITEFDTTAVLILSAFSQQDLIDKAQSAGAQGYLVKPFHKSEIVPAIETAYARFKEKQFLDKIDEDDVNNIKRTFANAKAILMDNHSMNEKESWTFIESQLSSDADSNVKALNQIADGSLAPTSS